jgi:flagellum-specific ATP synthase
MTSRTRSPTRRAPFSTATSCCRASWPKAGHFPAIDIEQSASRVMHNVVTPEHFEVARRFRAINSRYQKGKDLVQIGAYAMGADPGLDEAIRLNDGMTEFLQQGMFDAAPLDESLRLMTRVISKAAGAR